MEQQEQFQKWLDESSSIVFFGGAGVSTESGVPDFRSVDGLYHQQFSQPPEVILSHTYYVNHTEEFFRFYREKMLFLDAKPNEAHIKLAQLEAAGKLKAVITQNIDGLHQAAGSKKVLELHGSVHRNFCQSCGAEYSVQYIKESKGVPVCEKCGRHGNIKPDVVLYEEGLNDQIMNEAIACIKSADMLIIGGTSLVVYPAAGLVHYYNRSNGKIVLINKSATSMDNAADLLIREPIGEVFKRVVI